MLKKKLSLKIGLLFCLIANLFLSGCATTGTADSRDPLEGFNRGVYSFNKAVDNTVIDPITGIYRAITPNFLDKGISNFFSNLSEISTVANDLLQFKLGQAVKDSARFIVNSTMGLLGIFDIASKMDLPKNKEDFGQTLAHWGVGSGPYLMLPFFGPTTLRDVTRFPVDGFLLNPVAYLENDSLRMGLFGLNFVDIKSDLLSATDLVGEVSIDEYEFIKNAYFQQREMLINDGQSELEEFPDF